MSTAPVFFLIAGEASGDILGARLMRKLRVQLNDRVRFVGIGGPQMLAEGIELLFPHTELMHFGVIEVLRHIPRLLARINQTVNEVIKISPAALITIDAPDFCFRVAKGVKEKKGEKIPLIHYVAPTVWAWRPGRAKKIAKFLDHLLAVLPFEPPYFIREGLACTFVGHSVVEGDASKGSNAMFRAAHQIALDTPLLTLLPGSRTSEITRLLPIFRKTLDLLRVKYPTLQIVVPTVPHLKNRIEAEIATWSIPFYIVEGERSKYDAFAASRAALACSGTVALELALARLPSLIAYKINILTSFIARRVLRVRYVNLINIMHDKEVVPEFLQENCTPEKLAHTIDLLLSDETVRQKQIHELAATASWLSQAQFIPSDRAAETVLAVVNKLALPAETMVEMASNEVLEKSVTSSTSPTVLQIVPALVTGGVERGTVETTAALVKAGFKAIVASAGGPMVREVVDAGGLHITLPLASKNPFIIHANIERLSHVIRENKVDIVHARSRAPAWSAYKAARATDVPFVTTFHSAYSAGSAVKRWYNSVMAKGARVIAVSDFVANYAEETYGLKRQRLRVIHRGVDMTKFDPSLVSSTRVDALRSAWNLTSQTPLILMPARLTRWKGQSVLVQALAKLERTDFFCVIVGGGKNSRYGQELAREIKHAGLERNIAIFDTCRDMPAAYCLADIVVVPSIRPEGFGRVVIEAQAMGAPVIASNHGGATETVIQGETGWLTSPGDPRELAQRINKILAMPLDEKRALKARTTAHIRTHFTTDLMTAKTLEVYRELLQRR